MKKKLFLYTFIGIIFVSVAGTILHFAYEMSDQNYIVGLFAPVNESIWEHMKLLFFPMLVFALISGLPIKLTFPKIISALAAGIVVGTLLIPALYYTYTGALGFSHPYIDIGIFYVSVIIAFVVTYKATLSGSAKKHTFILALIILSFIAGFVLFSYNPPSFPIFSAPKLSQLNQPENSVVDNIE